ncbi:hypothetical protein BX265_5096 [Streptomyces sp. TLI_235]|nr:hypothetical protein [Streptomyces sp. TLI_235]PBC70553.1 hypothetical protein BX265_5096 [Streptomyces sp. TLI_235]
MAWVAEWAAGPEDSGHPAPVAAVATAVVDGRPVAASAGQDGTVRWWDPAAGRALGGFAVGSHPAIAVAVVAGRPVVLTVGDYDPRFVRDPLTGDCLWALPVDDATAVAVCSPAGRPIAVTGHEDGTTRTWDLTDHTPLGPVLGGHGQAVHAIAVTVVDGRPVAATSTGMDVDQSWDHDVLVRDLTDGRLLARLPAAATAAVNAVALTTANGRAVLATGDWRGALRLWDVPAAREFAPRPASHHGMFGAMTVAQWAAGPVLATGGDEGTLRLTDLTTRGPSAPDLRLPQPVTALAALPGERLLAAHGCEVTVLVRRQEPRVTRPGGEGSRGEGSRGEGSQGEGRRHY